jgi:organic radical activating enzyme
VLIRRPHDPTAARFRPPAIVERDGKVESAFLEVNVAEHCNLSCASCSHLSPLSARALVDPDELLRDLTLLGGTYRTAELRLIGGEPLLHPRLLDVVAAVRASGIAGSVALVTNGVLLPRAPAELWERIDSVVVSLYAGHDLTADELARCRELAAATGTRFRVRRVTTFRESYAELGTDDDALVERIYASCGLKQHHTLAGGVLYRCAQSYFLQKQLELGLADGLPVEGDAGFGERLLAFLRSPTPLASCRHCLGTSGVRFAHAQTPRVAFRERQRRTTEELLDVRYLRTRERSWLSVLGRGRSSATR